ncbi:MAG: OmpA family protein [Bacteroidetes bacterium]|nr:OmpA family protein [Bacteroidota bacterium]
MRKNWLLLLLASILVFSGQNDAQAQQQREKYRNPANDPVAKLPYNRKIRWADGLFEAGSYFTAIEYYSQLKAENPRNPYLSYQLAECYAFSRDYGPAAKNYGEAYALASKIYPEAKFKEAKMLKMQGLYDSSIHAFEKFMADNPKTYKKLKKTAKREIDGCIMGKNSINDPVSVTMKNAGPNVNSPFTESSPYPLGDTALLFSTMNQNSTIDGKHQYYARFMTSHKQYNVADVDSFQWPLVFNDGPFNDLKSHTGNGCYSPGGDRFYFTHCKESDTMSVICRIYVSQFDIKKGVWQSPELLGEGINDGSSNTHPFVAKVGKKEILFFSSNRKIQSRGKYDIWYSVIDPARGTYRRPQNAGKQINTEGNEMTPYYDSRVHKLYFASDGLVSMGGFDIYSADGGPSRYTNVKNMGYPINTSADELYYIKDPVGKPDAYVVSNRIGSIALKNPTCCDDIWRIQVEPKLQVMGKVLNSKTQKEMNDVVVRMVDETGNLRTFNSEDGQFQFNMAREHTYVFTGDKSKFVSTRAQVSTEGIKRSDPDQTVNVVVYLDSITMNKSFRVTNVYYDYDKADLRPESIASLDSLVSFMKDNPSLSVEVYSFTDANGTDDYNKDLSLRRAQAVRSYLTSQGIDDRRLIAKGFGEKMPAAPNFFGNKDNPGGRQLNRRTEFRILQEDPTRRIIYNSAKKGTIGSQESNLQIQDQGDDNDPGDPESEFGNPGSRVHKDTDNP